MAGASGVVNRLMSRWDQSRRRIATLVWGAEREPSFADWAEIGPDRRKSLARRAAAVATASIVGSNALIGLETFLLVQLAYNGGQLDRESTIGAPNFPAVVAAIVVGLFVNVVLGLLLLRPQLRWFVSCEPADEARRRAVQRIPLVQVAGTVAAWVFALVCYAVVARDLTPEVVLGVATAFTLAGLSSGCLTYLFAERAARPLSVVALQDNPSIRVVHGVHGRMLAVWMVSSAVPMVGLVIMNVGRRAGLLPPVQGTVDWATVVLAVVGLLAGARVIALVGRAIIDPLTEMRRAIERIHAGDLNSRVDVYDSSELGVLQHGFNDMVVGLDERDRMRELFARHVGDTVAELAIERGMGLNQGANVEVAVLFVDIVGSTSLAQRHDPDEIASMLNAFFGIVAEVVDEHGGLVNKFEGDAALAIFGAPVELDDSAGAALGAARDLAHGLAEALRIEWGIGVSYGTVFAGNIGAERRYEYTVIGDAVNESARISELAKSGRFPVLASGAALAASDSRDVQRSWTYIGRRALRGRSDPTQIYTPVDVERDKVSLVDEVMSGLLWPAKRLGVAGMLRSSPRDD